MLKSLIIFAFILISVYSNAQQLAKPSSQEIATLPFWAQEMYSENPNMFSVDSNFTLYYSANPFVKTYHTQYYRFWRRKNVPWINEQGFIKKPDPTLRTNIKAVSTEEKSNWSLIGPKKVWAADGTRKGQQTNVYSITQCLSHPNVLYCGTEPGEVYRSLDEGINWSLVTLNESLDGGVTAICVDPTDSAKVFAGSGDFVFVSTDAGNTWSVSLSASGLGPNEILVHPQTPNIIFVAAEKGFYKSIDGGQNWNQIYTASCWDVKLRPGTNNIVYLLKTNATLKICEFYLSNDTGSSFTLQSNGWYTSSDPARYDGGARIAVSPADPQRVYAYLIGDSKTNDYGFIGVYRSNDGGQTWILPNGPAGGPYTTNHLNLAYGQPSWTYHQGFYNCAIMADPTNADHILIGGLNLYRSNNGGLTFNSVAGYVGGPLDIHVDMQDFRTGVNGVWITNDGGIYYSTDFFNSDNQVKMDGIHGSEFWGFGQGWNEDVMVGGLYHNGTVAYYQNYPQSEFIQLGGAEPASGYVNPGQNRKVYSSDVGGAIIPSMIGNPIQYFSVGMWPNESYWASESSEMKFDPRCYNIAWIGNQNKLYKSVDGGVSYNLIHTFGTNTSSNISYFEICQSNPDIMYVVQRSSKLWKTIDGGLSWAPITIPAGNSSRILLTVSPTNQDSIWIAYPSGANGQKVFLSINGGTSWSNLTTILLNNQEIRSIINIGATNGGIYCCTNNTVFYRNNNMSDWITENNGLPVYMNNLYARPFYRDGKIRVSTYGRGIWENTLYDQPSFPVAQPQVDKLTYTLNCEIDSFYFEDHSILNHSGATWQWNFPGGSPSFSNIRNPVIYYGTPGTYTVRLIVTNNSLQSDTGFLTITIDAYQQNTNLAEGFQTQFPPLGWWSENSDNGPQWSLSTQAGGYSNSTQSAIFDNYNFDSQGSSDYLCIRTNMAQQPDVKLKFDYAYAPYGYPYSDSLSVVVSTDCGNSFISLWKKGGSQLATAPTETGQTFIPTSSQWRTDSIDLTSFANQTDLLIAFKNTGYWGQAIYVDNINLTGNSTFSPSVIEKNKYASVYPNPVIAGQELTLVTSSKNKVRFVLYNIEGKKMIEEYLMDRQKINVSNLSSGNYYWTITDDNSIRTGKLIIVDSINK